MPDELEMPKLNMETIRQKSEEYALQGALKTIEEFYTGWESPYKKKIKQMLEEKGTTFSFGLPDIVAVLNEGLSKAVDEVANGAIAQTYIPLVKQFLTRVEKEIKFSDILKEFISCYDYGVKRDEYEVYVTREEKYSWLTVNISTPKNSYEFVLHQESTSKQSGAVQKYCLLSLPRKERHSQQTMKLSMDGVSLELPFTRDVLSDRFLSYLAKLLIADSHITIDTEEFDSEWFPHHCVCD